MPILPVQAIEARLTRAAIFLVIQIAADKVGEDSARALLGNMSALIRSVGFRDAEGQLSCVAGIGSDAWDRLRDAKAERASPFP